MHLDDELAQRLCHDELSGPEAMSARAHLDTCPACRARVAELEGAETLILGKLRLLDHPASAVSAQAVVARAGVLIGNWRRWAAVAVFAVGFVGAAYAIPGSPVRRWILGAMSNAVQKPTAPRAPRESPGFGGIAVAPDARLVVAFATPDSTSRVVVRLVVGTEVVVRAPAGAATYTADLGRVVVVNGQGSVDFEVEIPTSAPRVEIRVGSTLLFLKDGNRLHGAGQLEGAGPFVLSLAPL